MIRLPWQKTQLALGVDFGTSMTQVVSLRRCAGIYQLEQSAVLPPQAELTLPLWQQALLGLNLAAHTIVLAVPNGSVMTKTLPFAAAFTQAELAEQVQQEARQLLPQAETALAVDFTVLGPHQTNPLLQEVLLVVCRQEEILNRTQSLKNLGGQVNIIDVEAFALARAYLASCNRAAIATVAIIDINEDKISIIVLQEQQLVYRREEILATTLLSTEALSAQIQTQLQFFTALHSRIYLQQLVLSGPLAVRPTLLNLLQAELNVPVSLLNPFAQMQLSATIEAATSFGLATGLALRGFEGKHV